jgi:hypothetical protein
VAQMTTIAVSGLQALSAPRVRAPRTAPTEWYERIDQRAWWLSTDPMLIDDPIEASEAKDPMLPTDANEPMLAIDSVEPVDPIDSTESRDHSDHLELSIAEILSPLGRRREGTPIGRGASQPSPEHFAKRPRVH